ncbi:MAG: phosphate signaling complex protein PhoU [Candidatus Omnitrophota bacterium]
MKRYIDTELAGLKKQLLKMGMLAEASIFESIESLKNLDAERAGRVISGDKAVDELENNIDEMCLRFLALKQPVALDLRFVTMSMKVTTDLERIADLAVDIAQRVIELSGKPLLKPLIDIPVLSDLAKLMTRDALSAFINKEPDLAGKVILLDSEADRLRNLVQKELVEGYISKDLSTVSRAVPLLLVARHLERICDHATNIAEDVIYMVRGDIVKHHPERLKKKVLFICVQNSCRSQMAEGFAKALGKDAMEVYSAGSKPRGTVDPLAIQVMKEAGIDIRGQRSKGFNEVSHIKFDQVISMGCADVCPFFPANEHTRWQIEDPKGKDIETYRKVRDEIKNKIYIDFT